jgi:nitrite reductase (NO-forming)
MLTRREALLGTAAGAAAAALLAATAATPALAEVPAGDISTLPREKVTLVAPPFVHAHQQVATGGPKVVEFQLTVKEQPMVIDDEGTTMQATTSN